MQHSSTFLIWKAVPWLRDLESLLHVLYPEAVSLLCHCCGVLPQHLDYICDIPNGLDVPTLTLMWPYDLVNWLLICLAKFFRSQFHSPSTTWWVDRLSRMSGMVTRWLRWLRYVMFCLLIKFLLTCSIFS